MNYIKNDPEGTLNLDKEETYGNFRKDLLIIITIFFISLFLWNTFIMYPVKLFVVSLHELSHGIAAIISGGQIIKIQIDPRIGGYCAYMISSDTSVIFRIFISSAGYLGSMFWGAIIFIFSSRTKMDRIITTIITLSMGVLSSFVIRSGELFGIIFCIAFTVFLIIAIKWFSDKFHDIFLKFIGLSSCLYVITDIKSDLIDRTGIGSDADKIAEITGLKSLSVPIGIFWIIISLIVLFVSIKLSIPIKRSKNKII